MVQSREGPRVTPGGLIRPSPLPAGAPTEQEILAGMIGPRPPNKSLTGSRGAVHGQGPMTSNQPNELFATIYRAPFNPEVLKRPEARALQAALSQGHVTVEVLLQHFAHGQMPALQREILLNILKLVQSQGHLGHAQQAAHLPNRGGGLSPLPPDALAILQQQRLSPGLLGGGGGGAGAGGLTVVSPTHNQRIPSPQELQVHTQQVRTFAFLSLYGTIHASVFPDWAIAIWVIFTALCNFWGSHWLNLLQLFGRFLKGSKTFIYQHLE